MKTRELKNLSMLSKAILRVFDRVEREKEREGGGEALVERPEYGKICASPSLQTKNIVDNS